MKIKKNLIYIIVVLILIILNVYLVFQILALLNNKYNTKYLDKGVKIADIKIYKINEAIYKNNIKEVKKLIKWTNLNKLPLSFDDDYDFEDPADIYSDDNLSPLEAACRTDNYKIAKLLVENGADVNYEDPLGEIIFGYDGNDNEYNIVKLLVENGANLDFEYLDDEVMFDDFFKDAYISNEEITSTKAKTSLKIIILFTKVYDYNKNELYILLNNSVRSGNLLIVKYLIEYFNLDVNHLYEANTSLLMIAAGNDHKEIVKYLLKKNANILIKNNEGKTALYYAKLQNDNELVELLK